MLEEWPYFTERWRIRAGVRTMNERKSHYCFSESDYVAKFSRRQKLAVAHAWINRNKNSLSQGCSAPSGDRRLLYGGKIVPQSAHKKQWDTGMPCWRHGQIYTKHLAITFGILLFSKTLVSRQMYLSLDAVVVDYGSLRPLSLSALLNLGRVNFRFSHQRQVAYSQSDFICSSDCFLTTALAKWADRAQAGNCKPGHPYF